MALSFTAGLQGSTVRVGQLRARDCCPVDQIQAWDRQARDVEPTFAYWPTGSQRPEVGEDTAALVKTHGVATISWPAVADAAAGQGALHNPRTEE